jgi:hypothetical protein
MSKIVPIIRKNQKIPVKVTEITGSTLAPVGVENVNAECIFVTISRFTGCGLATGSVLEEKRAVRAVTDKCALLNPICTDLAFFARIHAVRVACVDGE